MPLRNPQNLLLSAPAARGGKTASDAVRVFMSFSCHSLKSGTKGESKGESLGSLSFAISLWNDKETASQQIPNARGLPRWVRL